MRRIKDAKIWNSPKIGIVIAISGCLMMIYGVYRGEMDVVFMKAVRICLECIGIG